ncbi:FAD binding domain-containing protein [Penicillium chermesinum]|nr:FAD binding domain-containing protein [Penicillium chermesinum]
MPNWSFLNSGLLLNGLTATSYVNETQFSTGYPACDSIIHAGLADRLLLPTDTEYAARISGGGTGYWSWNSRQHPFCIVQPRSAEEVSKVVTALLEAGDGSGDWHIAVRAGGHSTGGFNNIDNGVTIDLGNLNDTTYDEHTNTASIGAGAHWVNVYHELDKHGVLVTGGRDGHVGVGGFLLGGGSTYFMGTHSFACDSIKNYEIVLADGRIINANKDENADLWKALKGGGANFGIVTRFDMEALPNTKLAYRVRLMSFEHHKRLAKDFVDFTNTYEDHPNDALVFFMRGAPKLKQSLMGALQVNTEGKTEGTGLAKIDEVPHLPIPNTGSYEIKSLYESALHPLAGDQWQELVEKGIQYHEQLVQDLKQTVGNNFTTYFFFQPIPTHAAKISEQKGGNVLGLDNAADHAVLFTATALVPTSQHDKVIAQAKINSLVTTLKRDSQELGGNVDLVYMNYADSAQDPLGSYGAKNVEFLTKVAQQYDPEGLFQTRFPLGFKISRTNKL